MSKAQKLGIIVGCIGATFIAHRIHSEFIQIIIDAGSFVGIVILALESEDCK